MAGWAGADAGCAFKRTASVFVFAIAEVSRPDLEILWSIAARLETF
jgi:hypothetical protein